MRQKHLNLIRLSQFFAAAMLLGAAGFAGTSCNKADPNAERSEFISVYNSLDEDAEPVSSVIIGVRKGDYSFYVKTNVDIDDLQFEWQDNGTSPWASFKSVEPTSEKGTYKVTLTAKARASYGYYTRRYGTLMIYDKAISLGNYVTVYQGVIARFSNDCTSFKYGVANPLYSDGNVLYSSWTSTQKGYFLTEASADGVSYLYGRNGNLQLGDDKGHGACLLTPYVDAMRADSLLMVSFRAVAFTDGTVKDSNKLTAEIVGGGVFRDNPEAQSKKMEIEVPYYDVNSENFPDDMWNDAEYLLFVIGTDQNPITANTQIKLTSGSLTETGTANSRIFVTRVYIRRLLDNEKQQDEDFFTENGGSGVDKILGLSAANPVEDEDTSND